MFSQLYLFIKSLNFVILYGPFLISSWFSATVTAYWKHLLSFLSMGIYAFFYPIRRVYLWLTTYWIYFMTYVIQQMNTIKDKITTFHWCFRSNLISIKKWFKKFFDKFIYFIINYEFFVITLWMHCKLFIIVFRRNKLNCYC